MALLASIGAKLLLGGRWLLSVIGRGLAWLFEKPVRLVVAVLALALAWQLLISAPALRRDLAVSDKAGQILAGRVAAEKRAHQRTKSEYRLAQAGAARLEEERLNRVVAKQQEISDEVVEDYQRRLAGARARAGGLAEQLRAGAARTGKHPAGAGGDQPVPGVSAAGGRAAQAPVDHGFPSYNRSPEDQLERDLVATEQALQLDALIDWIERQAAIDPNAARPAGER